MPTTSSYGNFTCVDKCDTGLSYYYVIKSNNVN